MTTGGAAQTGTTIAPEHLRSLTERIFRVHGVNKPDAEFVTNVLLEANLRGHDSHGVVRVLKWVIGLKSGAINARCKPQVIRETSGTGLVDGDRGLGPVVAKVANELVAKKAREVGIGMISVRRASHIGMLQFYPERLAFDGLIGVVMSNTESGMAPFGGIDKILGTNPLAIGIPSRNGLMVLDMSTSQVARGKIVIAKNRGQQIPEGWAIDKDGQPTTDPDAALAGALLPAGGPKGSGLSIMVDLLSGALSGGAVATAVRGTFRMDQETTKGDFFIAIDPGAVGDLELFMDRVEDLRSDIRGSRTAPGVSRIYLPGELEMECRKNRLKGGIPIDVDLLHDLETLASATVA
jgi:L-2-hydroxycarboxylate dehydrogenase (NAD+)